MRSLTRSEARLGLTGLGATAALIGATMIAGAGPVAKLAGMGGGRRSLLALRLFGVRDLCLGIGLLRARGASDRGLARLMLELVALSQVGDLAVTTASAIRGGVSRQATAVVWLSAPATLVGALQLRRTYSSRW